MSSVSHAQGPPPLWVGMTDFGPVPYSPGGIPASGPIQGPLEDADYILFAQRFWFAVDTGDSSQLNNHLWTAPDIVDLEQSIPATDVDEWGGGLEIFGALYQHRLQPFDPNGPATLQELLETDALIALLFKHWTLYHQVATAAAWDPVAHNQHINMLVEAYTNAQTTTVLGVPFLTAGSIVSDRLELEIPDAWFANLPAPIRPPLPQTTTTTTTVQDCIDNKQCNLKGMPWKADENGFFSSTPGFDCDDFADAMGAGVANGKPGVTATTVRMTWKKGKGKSAHQVTKISSGGMYWLMDGQVGSVSGPHADGTPHDGEPLLSGPGGSYPHEPGSVRTGSGDRPLGDRPWVEPDPWYESPEMLECFESETGMDSDDYTPE